MDSKLLEKVIFITDPAYMPARFLIAQLESEGISAEYISSEKTGIFLKKELEPQGSSDEERNGILLITDSKEIYAKLHEFYPIYIYAHEGVDLKDFPQAVYIIEGLDDIDSRFLEGIYRRLEDIPWLIGEKDGITVREMTPRDAEKIHALYRSDEEWYTDNLEAFGQSVEETREYLKSYRTNRYGIYGYGMWVIADSGSGEVIGRIGFQETGLEDELELGFLIKREYRRRGIATHAARIVLDYMKENYPEFKITCVIRRENLPALSFINTIIQAGYAVRLQILD